MASGLFQRQNLVNKSSVAPVSYSGLFRIVNETSTYVSEERQVPSA